MFGLFTPDSLGDMPEISAETFFQPIKWQKLYKVLREKPLKLPITHLQLFQTGVTDLANKSKN